MMNLSAQEIATEILTLSESDQQKVLDLIESLKMQLPQQSHLENREVMLHFQASLQRNRRLGELLLKTRSEPERLGRSINPEPTDLKTLLELQETLKIGVNSEIEANNSDNSISSQTIGQRILAQLKETGYLGCFSDVPDLSKNYKEYLDWSNKV